MKRATIFALGTAICAALAIPALAADKPAAKAP